MANHASTYTTRKVGPLMSLDFRVFIEKDGEPVSPFHDVPLYANSEKNILNMIVEIPRWSNAKLEISVEEKLNPIKQDSKSNKPRFVKNCFPHKGYIWNYGAFPQTWEDPNYTTSDTKTKGDNDPLDVCEIGQKIGKIGEVKQVKVLGVLALLDQGETDWKVLVIDVNDPLAAKLDDIHSIEDHLPGLLDATHDWFLIYKIPDGKALNQFAFNGEYRDKKYALGVIDDCAQAWKKLISGEAQSEKISITNITIENSPGNVPAGSVIVPKGDDIPAIPLDEEIHKWFYIPKAARSG